MRLAFAHDHIFVSWEDGLYSPGRLPYEAWHRYLEHFDEVAVIARTRAAQSAEEVRALSRADGPRVRFQLAPALRGVRRVLGRSTAWDAALEATIAECDGVVARLPSELGLKAAALATAMKRPYVVEVVGDALHGLWHHGSLAARLYAPVLDLRMRRAVRNAAGGLYVTQSYLQQRYPLRGPTVAASNVTIVPPGERALAGRAARARAPQQTLVVGFVGTLADKHKGLDTLLAAVAKAESPQAFRVQVVGEGEQTFWRKQAERCGIAGQVEFLGALPGSAAVQSWMQGIDVYVLPTKGGEGLPRSLIEAMANGCLCFATALSGVPELLEPSHMFAPHDVDRLAALLQHALRAELRSEALARNVTVAERYAVTTLQQTRRGFLGWFAEYARSMRNECVHP